LVIYLAGPYDWRDTWKAVKGETPDRERVWLDLTDWPDEELFRKPKLPSFWSFHNLKGVDPSMFLGLFRDDFKVIML